MSAMHNTDSTANSRYIGMPMFHGPIFGHLAVPMVKKPRAIGTVNDRNRKIRVAFTTMVYMLVPPIETVCAIQTKRNSRTAPVQIAATGVRNLGLTFDTHLEMS